MNTKIYLKNLIYNLEYAIDHKDETPFHEVAGTLRRDALSALHYVNDNEEELSDLRYDVERLEEELAEKRKEIYELEDEIEDLKMGE